MISAAPRADYTFIDRWRIGVLQFLLIVGLLRLTNFNYYLSKLVGFETVVNSTGGNAFNFVNYFGAGVLFAFLISKLHTFRARWQSLWPYLLLLLIYVFNALVAQFVNMTWVLYQILFLGVGALVHVLVLSKRSIDRAFWEDSLGGFYRFSLLFMGFVLIQILTHVSVTAYIESFNDSFVQSLDDFGIMKQRYGFLIGFVLSYALFLERSPILKWVGIGLVVLTGFGIRSFVLGLVGAGLIFSLRDMKRLVVFAGGMCLAFILFLSRYFELLIYDTRFYSFLNGYDIVQKFPFGVGLGGYPVYTELNARALFGSFYNVRAVLDFVPIAPESDLVHLFGSLGLVCGALHLLVQFRIVWYSLRWQGLFGPFQKAILFYFCYMTFFGISEDNIFSINYWIFFGVATGVVSAAAKGYKY